MTRCTRVQRAGRSDRGPVGGLSRTRFTLIELLTVVAVIAILVALLMPVLGRAKEQARRAVCISQVRQLATASLLHAEENMGVLPLEDRNYGSNLFAPEIFRTDMADRMGLDPKELFQCPSRPWFEWVSVGGHVHLPEYGRKSSFKSSYFYLAKVWEGGKDTNSYDPHPRPYKTFQADPDMLLWVDKVYRETWMDRWHINHGNYPRTTVSFTSGGDNTPSGGQVTESIVSALPNYGVGGSHGYVDGHVEFLTNYPAVLDSTNTTADAGVSGYHTRNPRWGAFWWVASE